MGAALLCAAGATACGGEQAERGFEVMRGPGTSAPDAGAETHAEAGEGSHQNGVRTGLDAGGHLPEGGTPSGDGGLRDGFGGSLAPDADPGAAADPTAKALRVTGELELAELETWDTVDFIEVAAGRAYLRSFGWLHTLDVSVPSNPRVQSHAGVPFGGSIAVGVAPYVYVLDDYHGRVHAVQTLEGTAVPLEIAGAGFGHPAALGGWGENFYAVGSGFAWVQAQSALGRGQVALTGPWRHGALSVLVPPREVGQALTAFVGAAGPQHPAVHKLEFDRVDGSLLEQTEIGPGGGPMALAPGILVSAARDINGVYIHDLLAPGAAPPAFIETQEEVAGVALLGDVLLLAAGSQGLLAFDLRDFHAPAELDRFPLHSDAAATAVTVVDSIIYLGRTQGLTTLAMD